MGKRILIRPIISEKSERLSEKHNQYVFMVDKKANKIEIKNAVEEFYQVSVESVKTLVMPAKVKSRSTRTAMIQGRVSSFKKAVVTVAFGDEINIYGEL